MNKPYEEAKAGGKHAGFWLAHRDLPSENIRKGIKSLEKQVEKHRTWIKNPSLKVPNFRRLDPRHQRDLVENRWPNDIARQLELILILEGLLKERGEDRE